MTWDRTPEDERRATRRPGEGEPRRPGDAGDVPGGRGEGSGGGAGRLPYGRRRRTAASALAAMLVALVLGAFFNAAAMRKTALEQPFGAGRSVRLALVEPLATVSHWLLLDRPAQLTASVLGQPDPGAGIQVAVASPSPRPGGHKPPQERPVPKPYKGHPMHLYIAGDSMMGLPGMALTNLAGKTKLIKTKLDYRISSGLCRPDFYDWPAELQAQAEAFGPGAVALMFGANDTQAVQTASGAIYQFGTEGWKKEYRHRVDDVLALLFANGVRRVYWIGQPIMPSASFNEKLRLLNGIYREAAKATPGVRYIDAYRLFSDSSGKYAQYLPDADGEVQQVREQDGEHITYAGGVLLAQAVLDEIEKEWFPATQATPAP